MDTTRVATLLKDTLWTGSGPDFLERPLAELYYRARPIPAELMTELEEVPFPQIDNATVDRIALFPDFYPGSTRTVFKSLLAHGLYERGIGSIFVFGDRTLPTCQKKFSESDCTECVHRSRALSDLLGIEAHGVGEFVTDSGPIPEPHRSEIHSKDTSTMKGKYRIARVGDDGVADEMASIRRAGELAWQMAAGADDRYDYDYLVINMGPGLPVRGALEYGLSREKKIVGMADPSFGTGNGFIFNKGEKPLTIYMSDERWAEIESRELDDEQRGTIDELIRDRAETAVYQKYSEQGLDLDSELTVEPETETYALYTHLLWDAAIDTSVARAFDTHNDWVVATIEAFSDLDSQLVVKTHPAEAVRGTQEGVMEVIDDEFDDLPSNVQVLEPTTEVNTYDLVEFSDVSLVFASTVGLESAYMGTPVISVGDAHYAKKGFTHDVETPGEYVECLGQPVESIEVTENQRQRAVRYVYNFFIERPFYVDALDLSPETDQLLATTSFESLMADEDLNAILDSIDAYDSRFYYA